MDFETLYKEYSKTNKKLTKKSNIVFDQGQRIKLYASAIKAKSKTLNDCKKKMKDDEKERLTLKFIIILLYVIIICQEYYYLNCIFYNDQLQ
jgi:uncharacterized Rmd1/YagE family protein